MLTTLVVFAVLVGFFLGIATIAGIFAIIIRKDEKKKNPYMDAIDRGKTPRVGDNPFVPKEGPILS